MEATFDARLLNTDNGIKDLSRFARGNPVYPGVRELNIYLNDRWVAKHAIRFESPSHDADAVVCVDDDLLSALGVREDRWAIAIEGGPSCRRLDQWLPGAAVSLEESDHRIDFHIAQADLVNVSVGGVDPRIADEGVNAFRLNYAANTYRLRGGAGGADYDRSHLQFDAGINLWGWQFRHRSSQSWGGGGRESDTLAAYAQTSIPSSGLQLTLGEFNTQGAVFDSIGLRGIRVATDDRMRPESERGYAPVIRGTARSNALVTVSQNGSVIREVTVPAGNFELRDLYPTGYGGDLAVVVTETDGSKESFTVPYSSVPELLREGAARMGVSFGQWNDDTGLYQPNVLQVVAQHGFTDRFTGYAGTQNSNDYAGMLLGGALNTSLGALALDVTHARTRLGRRQSDVGNSLRLSYSNFFPYSQTAILVAAHRYASEGFMSIADVAAHHNSREFGNQSALRRIRNRVDLQIDQPLAGGSLYGSASLRNFWDGEEDEQFVQVGYSRNLKSVGVSTGVRRTLSKGADDTQWTLSLSLPLGSSANHSGRVFAQAIQDSDGGRQSQVAMTGSVGEHRQLSYGISHSNAKASDPYTGLSATYQGAYANVGATHSFGSQPQSSVSVEGGMLLHAGYMTLGQTLGETVGIIQAPDAAGARVVSSAGVKVDKSGHALVPNLAPYRTNTVELDPTGLPAAVQFDATAHDVVPRAGAVVVVPFATSNERSWLLHALKTEGGTQLPLGTRIVDATGSVLGVVDRAGYAFMRGGTESGALRAEWGQGPNESCTLAGGIAGDSTRELAESVTHCLGEQAES